MRYRSRVQLLGLPLIDVSVARRNESRGVAKGWIAVGDIAIGMIAIGGFASGAVAIGGLTIGLVSFAGVAVGALAVGGAAAGIWAMGGAAFAMQAALGGFAMAAHYAIGGAAIAPHANDAAATAYFSAPLFHSMRAAFSSRWLLLLLLLPVLLAFSRGAGSETPPS